ncbi:MAG TPA: hypothetical protein VER39_06005 [Nocardioidaceae bacterium]|nr:hypothetical protein [Nocardioidaceae bacterium]
MNADTSTTTAVLVLVGYAVVYCVPCLVLLAVGLSGAEPVRRRLRRLHDRFGTAADLPANRWKAAAASPGPWPWPPSQRRPECRPG